MRTAAFALASCALLLCLLASPPASADATVVSLTHSPLDPTPDDEVTVTLQLENATAVDKAFISWCQSNPELCNTPRQMKYIGDDAFALNLGKLPDKQQIKYNITLMYKDGNTSVTETKHFKVEKPSNGDGGNNNNTTNNNTNNTDDGNDDQAKPDYRPYIAVGVVVAVVVVAAAVFMMRKKPGSP